MRPIDKVNTNKLFWDVDVATFNPLEYPEFTICRILEYGDMNDFKWMELNFKDTKIKNTLMKTRNLSRKSGYFWADHFNISHNSIACLTEESQIVPDLY